MENQEKQYLLEVRAMTWKEQCAFEDYRDEVLRDVPDIASAALGRMCVSWLLEHLYPGMEDKLTGGEAMAVFNTTLELSAKVRYEEIKNLKPLSGGSTNEKAIAGTAED